MCAEKFSLKATDDLIKKLRLEITQLKDENDGLKRAQGGKGAKTGLEVVVEEDIMEMEVKVIRVEEGKGAEDAPTIMPEEMMRSSLHRET